MGKGKILFLACILLLSFSGAFASSHRVKESDKALYNNKAQFNQLDSAGQRNLLARIGKEFIRSDAVSHSTTFSPRPLTAIANVLVNSTAADTTAQDTQSETAIVLAGPNI